MIRVIDDHGLSTADPMATGWLPLVRLLGKYGHGQAASQMTLLPKDVSWIRKGKEWPIPNIIPLYGCTEIFE
jgi:hypothetical protein